MAESKRGRGRPKGSLNKTNIRNDVKRALKSGQSLTDISLFMSDYLDRLAEDKDHKNVVAIVKQMIELTKYLHKLELDFIAEDESGEDEDDDYGEGTVLKFGRK